MKTRKTSQASLLAGITLAIIALWAGATPFAGADVAGVGGAWSLVGMPPYYDEYVAGPAGWFGSCTYCYGTTTDSCTNYADDGGCYGGYVSVALCSESSSAGGTTHMGGSVACWDSGSSTCDDAHDASCY